MATFQQPPIIGDEFQTRMGFGEAEIGGLRPLFGSGRHHSRNLAADRNRKFTQITALHKLDTSAHKNTTQQVGGVKVSISEPVIRSK
ncbi:hypothetical protein GCM10022296_00610 [Secundilactobacillus similis DSM 23365 = JCM 2765]